MITKKQFEKIKNEVEGAINQALNTLKEINKDNYIKYIIQVEQNNGLILLEMRKWEILDETRMKFLTSFMNTYYAFDNGDKKVCDDEYRFNLEMMIYTHCWESECFLQQLIRLTQSLNGEEYNTDPIEIPVSKENWLKNNVYNPLKNNGLKLGDIIHERYDKHFRNSFAHSSYSIKVDEKRISLHNVEKEVTFDNWSKYFVYTFWLTYRLPQIIRERRDNLTKEFNTKEFTLNFKVCESVPHIVKYDEASRCFR